MNVSDLLQDSPSQHRTDRRRPPPLQHDSPPAQSTPVSLPSTSVSPPSQHPQQHSHAQQHASHPPPAPQPSYPPQPSQYYQPHPFSRPDPAPMHRITPRPPSQMHQPHVDATPAMGSLQHPSPSAPSPHVHPHPTPWGPPPPQRQGSSPLTVSSLAPGSASLHARSHHQQQQQQIKSAMPGSDRSPIVQRAHASGSSTPSNIAAHSPTAKPLLTTAAGVLILDNRTADDQLARSAQAQQHGLPSAHPNTSPGTAFKPGREREREWEQRERQEDMDHIRHVARERVVGGPYDRDRERERALPSPRERSLASPHDRSIPSALDRPIPSPHERDRPPLHIHRMSPLARAPPTQPPPPLRTPVQSQQSPPGSSHRIPVGPPPHDRIPPPIERDRMPPIPHERPPHDRDRIHPPPFSHRQVPPLLPGQGQFQTHPPEWDPPRERDMTMVRERERDMSINVSGPPRDLAREKDLDLPRDFEYGFDHDRAHMRERERQRMREPPRDQGIPPLQRERDVIPPSQRNIPVHREREREMQSVRERERLAEREREMMSRETEAIPMPQRERDIHIQRERERVAVLHREGETGPGMPPRVHDRERERERDRERRTHSRVPSPHAINFGGAGVPHTSSAGMTGPGAPGPLHTAPPVHDHLARERELQLANERERQHVWERERERDMERRQYRERMPGPDRDGERAIAERDRVTYERDRMAFAERERVFPERERLERERMAEKDRVLLERERMTVNDRDRDRVMHERERGIPPEQRVVVERERVILERPGDRDLMPMRPHSFDVLERERAETFEREREHECLEAIERDRERGLEGAGMNGTVPGRGREGEEKAPDVPVVEREREEHPSGSGRDREQERPELMEREPMNIATRETEHTDAEREHLETRERFELLQREVGELLERDRLGGLDIMERDRLVRLERESFELLERERVEMLERERLEMLERMPSAEELAKARKEREKKPFVSLGMYVWPRTPFPYYFPEWIPIPIVEEDKSAEPPSMGAGPLAPTSTPTPQPIPAAAQIPTELRIIVLVPPSFLPPARPQKFRLWGGGLPPPPPFPYTPSIYSFSRRRVYTDDSDVIQCAVHAGLLTWSGITRAKKEGRAIRVVLALVPTLASSSGAVKSGQSETRIVGMNGLSANGHVNGTASLPRTRTNTPLPLPISSAPSTSSVSNEPHPPGYAGGVWASRFIGGWGESFYGEESAGRGDNAGRMTNFEEAEDDGRGCVSCGWGWGHDGSAFEVISVDVVEQNAHVAPGLGIRNRAQRLAEYAQRRADILGLPPPPSPPLLDVTNTPTNKRRKLNIDFTEMKKTGLSELVAMTEEAKKMQTLTISFGVPDRKKSKTGVGFKYDPQVARCALLSHLYLESSFDPPPSKRRKIAGEREAQMEGDVEMDSIDDPRQGIVFESTTETYLVTWVGHVGGTKLYTLSVLGPPEQPIDTLPANLSLPLGPPSMTPIADAAASETRPALAESREGSPPSNSKNTARDTTEPPASGVPTSMSQDTAPKNKENNVSSIPPPVPRPPPTNVPKPTMRVLRSNLKESDFSFEKDVIVVKGVPHDVSETKMAVDDDGDAFKMQVLRWRWYVHS